NHPPAPCYDMHSFCCFVWEFWPQTPPMETQGPENITRSSRWEGAFMCKHRSRWVALFSATTPATTVTAVPSAGGSGMKCPGPVAFSQAMVDRHRAAADPSLGGRSPAGTGHTRVPHQRVPEFLPPARDRPRRPGRGTGGAETIREPRAAADAPGSQDYAAGR